VAFSPDGKSLVAQSGKWLQRYRHDGEHWRPIANRHLPVYLANAVRFFSD
jgi:hypothetical protein